MSTMIPKSVLARVKARSGQAWDAPPNTTDHVSCRAPQPPATEGELQRARGLAATLLALRALPKPS